MKTSRVPCQYFCRRNNVIWDILLSTEEVAAKLASKNIITKIYQLQPEYMDMRRIKVVIHNAPVNLPGDNLAFFLSTYGQVEEIIPLRGGTKMTNGDYAFILCLKRKVFQVIPDTIQFCNLKLLIIIEGCRAHSWSCRQTEHLAMNCSDEVDVNKAPEQPTPTESTSKSAEGRTEVVRKGRKSACHSEGKTKKKNQWKKETAKKPGN